MVTRSDLRGDGRGQTLQDFTVGILLFILTVTIVLTTLLGHVNPYWEGVGSDEVSQSERIVELIRTDYSAGADPTELSAEGLENQVFSQTEAQLRNNWNLGRATNVFIEVRTVDGSSQVVYDGTTFAVGSGSGNQATAKMTRLVTLDDGPCDPVCKLTVEVW